MCVVHVCVCWAGAGRSRAAVGLEKGGGVRSARLPFYRGRRRGVQWSCLLFSRNAIQEQSRCECVCWGCKKQQTPPTTPLVGAEYRAAPARCSLNRSARRSEPPSAAAQSHCHGRYVQAPPATQREALQLINKKIFVFLKNPKIKSHISKVLWYDSSCLSPHRRVSEVNQGPCIARRWRHRLRRTLQGQTRYSLRLSNCIRLNRATKLSTRD